MSISDDGPVVTNQPDADRVARAVIAFVEILFTEDPRVRACYDAWLERWNRRAARGEPPQLDDMRAMIEDVRQLKTLVLAMRLDAYEHWLPKDLFLRFVNGPDGPLAYSIDLPPGAHWEAAGRHPKHGPIHREDIARNVSWYYRHCIKAPPETVTALALEYARAFVARSEARSVIQDGIKRAKHLLACVKPPA